MTRLTILFLVACCTLYGCGRPQGGQEGAAGAPYQRIVSLDYCADQFVLKLLDRDRILAVSPEAQKSFSYMRDHAAGIGQVRSLAEDVVILRPDLVVRSYGGGPNAGAFFEKAGIPVLQIGYASDIEAVKTVLRDIGAGLGESEKAERIIDDMDRRLADIQALSEQNKSALYMTPGGVTTGPGSLIHEMLEAAGLANFEEDAGWRALPLERLAYERPDMVAAAFFETKANRLHAWSATRHPIAKKQITELETVFLDGAWTTCGGWFLLDAIEALAGVKEGGKGDHE